MFKIGRYMHLTTTMIQQTLDWKWKSSTTLQTIWRTDGSSCYWRYCLQGKETKCWWYISFDGTSLEDYHQTQFIEQNYNCITFRKWQEREETLKQATTASVPTTYVEIITAGAADSDYVSPLQLLTGSDCADDLFEMTNNNSDKMLGDILNDVYRNDAGIDSPMKKKQLFEYETPSKPRSKELLRFKNTDIP